MVTVEECLIEDAGTGMEQRRNSELTLKDMAKVMLIMRNRLMYQFAITTLLETFQVL